MLTTLVLYNCQDLGRKFNGDFEDLYEDYCMLDECLTDIYKAYFPDTYSVILYT